MKLSQLELILYFVMSSHARRVVRKRNSNQTASDLVPRRAYLASNRGRRGVVLRRHIEADAKETIAFRAAFWTRCRMTGGLPPCGHERAQRGSVRLALSLEGKRLGRNIVLIFQHAEETGEGGAECAAAFKSMA